MSLLNSIFGGEAPDKGASKANQKDTPDLFGNKISVPAVLHKKTLSPQKQKKAAKGTTVDSKNTDNDSSSNDKKQQDSSTQQLEDAAEETSTKKVVAKKTKEEIKEEEERTIFVGNLPPDVSRRALAGIFKPCGTVASARLRSVGVAGVKLPPDQAGNQNMMRKVCVNTGKVLSDTPKKSAQGYVVFESTDSIPKALEMNNTTYQSHTIRVDHANPTIESSRSVFVGNLPYHADEETLISHFLESLDEEEDLNEHEGSAIKGVRIIREKDTQKCKGFGYVTLRDATLVPLALQLHGSTYMKRELRVMVCGKRFKGKRGDDNSKDTKMSGGARRAFEGQRATRGDNTKMQSSKRKADEGGPSGGSGKVKKRRARSEKRSAPGGGPNNKSGMSRRAATEKKVNKRVKKLERRAVKGMGKKH